ncbi:MAG: hypothetical protein WKF55_10865 [Gemmatimonadaceae bacterium]
MNQGLLRQLGALSDKGLETDETDETDETKGLGMDVHKDSITIAVLLDGAKVPTRLDRLPNDRAAHTFSRIPCQTQSW